MSIENEPEFLAMLAGGAKTEKARSGVRQSNALTAETVLSIIGNHGYDAIPKEIFKIMAPAEVARLGEEARTLIYEKVIAGNTGHGLELWYVPSPLIHSAIPAGNPGSKTQFLTCSGNFETTISMPLAADKKNQLKMPHGIPGRQTLSLLTTLAKTSEPGDLITLPATKKQYLEDIFELEHQGGTRGRTARYAESLVSWLNATIHIVQRGEVKGREGEKLPFASVEPMAIVEKAVYWGSKDFVKADGIQLVFSTYFNRLAKAHAVPIDRSTQNLISKLDNPLCYDLYHWAAYRANSLAHDPVGVVRISWKDFHAQFMSGYSSHHAAAKAAKKAIEALNEAGVQVPLYADKKALMLTAGGAELTGAVMSQQPLL